MRERAAEHGFDPAHSGKRRRPLLIAVACALALVVAVPIGLWWRLSRSVEAAIDAIRARGEPVTAADMHALHIAPPPDQDCTSLYMIHERGKKPWGWPRTKHLPGFSETPFPRLNHTWYSFVDMVLFLNQIRTYLDSWHQAAELGGQARFPVQFEDGFSTLLPYVQGLREAERCLLLEAHVRAYNGDHAGTTKSLLAALATEHALENEPFEVSQLVRLALHRYFIDELLRLLPQLDFTAEELERLQAELMAVDFRRGLRTGMLGDRAAAIISARDARLMAYESRMKEVVHKVAWQPALLKLLQDYDARLALLERPWPEILRELPAPAPKKKPGPLDLPFDEFLSSMRDYLRVGVRTTAQNQIGILALAIAHYRLDNGHFPAALADLSPDYLTEIPTDATTGEPFNYQTTGEGLRLWSGWHDASSKVDAETHGDENLLFRWLTAGEK